MFKRYCGIFIFLALTACGNEPVPQARLSDTGKPALHAIQSERLHQLMTELNDLMFERMLTETEIDRQRRFRTEAIAQTAAKMRWALTYIPTALDDLTLDPKAQELFINLNQKLDQQLQLLQQEAEQNQVDAIPQRLDHIVETCNACHHIFRQLPPP